MAALDLTNGFAHQAQLASSAQSFLDVFVDDKSPARETFARISRVTADTDLRKSFFGKNMLHAHEHALIMYLHGRALEGRPASLYYAFPEDEALTAVAKPYWFDAAQAGPRRPGRPGVAAWTRTRRGRVHRPQRRAPSALPRTRRHHGTRDVASVVPEASTAGWHNGDVAVTLSAADDTGGVGVKEIHAQVIEQDGAVAATAHIDPGEELVLPALSAEGEYDVTFFAVDRLGNQEAPQSLTVRIDRTAPAVAGFRSTVRDLAAEREARACR